MHVIHKERRIPPAENYPGAKYKGPKDISLRFMIGDKIQELCCRYGGESNEIHLDEDVV